MGLRVLRPRHKRRLITRTATLPRPLSAGLALRRATAAAHEEVDAIFSAVDLSDARGYRTFLLAQAYAHLPVEAALDAAGAERVIPDWPARRRAPLLLDDLARLGAMPERGPAPSFASDAEVAGAAYVLEGSRLGAKLLRHAVPAGLPRAFVDAPAAPGAWRTLLVLLDDLLPNDDSLERATAAASATFALFAASGQRMTGSLRG